MMLQEIISKVAEEENLPREDAVLAYRYYWKFIKSTIANIDLENSSLEELEQMKLSFNIPSLGKLYTNPKVVYVIKKNLKRYNKTYDKD